MLKTEELIDALHYVAQAMPDPGDDPAVVELWRRYDALVDFAEGLVDPVLMEGDDAIELTGFDAS